MADDALIVREPIGRDLIAARIADSIEVVIDCERNDLITRVLNGNIKNYIWQWTISPRIKTWYKDNNIVPLVDLTDVDAVKFYFPGDREDAAILFRLEFE